MKKEPAVTDEDTTPERDVAITRRRRPAVWDCTLTEAEVDDLRQALRHWLPRSYEGGVGYIARATERIIAQRTAADHVTIEAVRALAGDLWRVTPCGCGHRADLHTMGAMDVSACTGGLGLCDCNWSFVRIVQERLRAALGDDVRATNRAGL